MQDPFADTLEARKYIWDENGILIPDPEPLPFLRQQRRIQAARRLGSRPGPQVRHPHRARHSPPGRRAETCPLPAPTSTPPTPPISNSPCPWDQGNWGVTTTPPARPTTTPCSSSTPIGASTTSRSTASATTPIAPLKFARSPKPSAKPAAPSCSASRPAQPSSTTPPRSPNTRRCGASPTITGTAGPSRTIRHRRISPSAFAMNSTASPNGPPYVKPGNWPDPDMLPEGCLGPHPGKDQPRQSNYTHDEQRTEFTLWAISRSPLILGANLTKLDDFTRSLITNKEVTRPQSASRGIQARPACPNHNPASSPSFSATGTRAPADQIQSATSPSSISLTLRPSSNLPWMLFHLENKPLRRFTTSGTRNTFPAPKLCT